MVKIALFASGNGTNVQRISEYFTGSDKIKVELILCNRPDAYVVERARILNIPSVVFTRDEFYNSEKIIKLLKEKEIAYIILAGFLWMIPQNLLNAYSGKIINIHPALLPGYGGKGMYGMKVHEAVIGAGEIYSGITIHHVNERYDEGEIIFQAKCKIEKGDTPELLAEKIHKLEYEHFPRVIEEVILNR
jgi:phosphoribosylglycinamide formyltransferase-1